MNDPIVSIVVPCYKQAHFLDEALQSVKEQTFINWECIIVNDGSPDATEEVAKKWCDLDNRFIYFYQLNGGLSSARNAGIKISKGKFILPLDSDDILHQDYLTKLVPILAADSTLAIVSCYTQFFSMNKENIVHELRPYGNSYLNFMFENNLVASSLFRRKSWEDVGGYDESMKKGFEDWEFWIAITKSGLKYRVVEEFLFFYRKSQHSMLIDTLKNHRITIMKYIFNKHKEIYIENYYNTIENLFFHMNLYRNSEMKYKNSIEFKLGSIICKPYRFFQNLIAKK